MATGFTRTRSTDRGHDEINDDCGTSTEGENLNAEAHLNCRHVFCEACKKYHNKFIRTHRFMTRSQVAKQGNVKHAMSSLTCNEHPGKGLEMFCAEHDRVCCSICVEVKHRGCKEVRPVSDLAKGIKKRSVFKTALSKASKTQSRLKRLHDKQDDNISMLQKARGAITATFKNMRMKFNKIVDRLEEDSMKELDKLFTMLKEQITSDKNDCFDIHDKIQTLLDDIETLGKHCDELAFQGFKKCSEQMTQAEKLLSSMKDNYQLKFIPGVKIEQYLSSLKILGSFGITSNPSGQYILKTDEVDTTYSVVNKKTCDFKTIEDKLQCGITGMCQLPDGQTAIVDCINSKVKLLCSSTYTVLGVLKLPSYPRDVCAITGTELAVTLWDMGKRREIRFTNAGNGKLSHTRTVKLDHSCQGIAFHNDQLYVGSFTALYVYNLYGVMIKKLYQGAFGKLATVFRFCFSDDQSRIYVINHEKNLLLTLDSSGHQLSTFRDSELKGPINVCVADNGSVFVCGLESHTVLQVDREGRKKVTTLANQDDGIYEPYSLCYDRHTNTLLVGQWKKDNLALQLK